VAGHRPEWMSFTAHGGPGLLVTVFGVYV